MAETSLNHPDVIDLLPGYAIGGLGEAEARLVAVHLETCDECRAELRAYEDLMAGIATAEIPQVLAPASLERRVMAHINPALKAASAPQPKLSIWERLRLSSMTLRIAGAIAMLALVIVAVVIGTQGAKPSLARTVPMKGTKNAPDAEALFEGNAEGTGATLRVAGLTPLDPSQQYQLWLVRADGSRDSGAVFSVEDDGSALVHISPPERLDHYEKVGVTIEPAGGSPGPTGPQVLAGS